MTLIQGHYPRNGLVQPLSASKNARFPRKHEGVRSGWRVGTYFPFPKRPRLPMQRFSKEGLTSVRQSPLWGTAPSARLTSISSLGRFLENLAARGLDTVGGLDLRKGYVGARRASRRKKHSACCRGLLRSRRNAGGGGDGWGLPPLSGAESAAAVCVCVDAPQPPFTSRGAEIRGK